MEGYLQAERGSCTTKQDGQEAMPRFALNQAEPAGRFAAPMKLVPEDNSDLDPLFFVESWTIGVSAAVQNLKQRRRWQQDAGHRSHAFDRFQSLSTFSFIQERCVDAEFLSPFGAAVFADSYVPGLPSQSRAVPSAPAHAWLPQEGDAVFEECDAVRPMTPQGARRLLGVTSTGTREQIRAAYRKMASRYHPDRLEVRSEKERQLGTDRMAAINEAYRLLCS